MCEVSSPLNSIEYTVSVWCWISLNASLLRAPQYRAKTSFFPSHFSYWLFPICQTRLGRCWNHFFPKSTSNKFSSEGGCEGGGCYPYVSPLSGRPQSRTDINIFRWWALARYVNDFHLGKKARPKLIRLVLWQWHQYRSKRWGEKEGFQRIQVIGCLLCNASLLIHFLLQSINS